jgi:hypothetical protein
MLSRLSNTARAKCGIMHRKVCVKRVPKMGKGLVAKEPFRCGDDVVGFSARSITNVGWAEYKKRHNLPFDGAVQLGWGNGSCTMILDRFWTDYNKVRVFHVTTSPVGAARCN